MSLPEGVRRQLELLAKHDDRSLGQIIRFALAAYLRARSEDLARLTAAAAERPAEPEGKAE
jgi:predicted transcriptional regulator